ncbi:pyridoxal 5'-phosphate synthase glutaminase subunit PdxT [Candidatus Peribacteria bacterium]|nr:pyridoxal 5'-phosphate synthase glutaminase subunit PdxT [Candidatus Peribacteria bacterium]
MVVGVLAFQGDFFEHIEVLHSLRVPAIEVRSLTDLSKVGALIIPGGESTVIAKFLEETGVGKEIIRRIQSGSTDPRSRSSAPHPLFVYGTCAGAIVLSKKVTGKNAPRTLGLIDITIDRNAYGAQLQSFEAEIRVKGISGKIPVSFIRAPKIMRVGKTVDVLAEYGGVPVLVRQGRVLIGTFHPEVWGDRRIHQLFLSTVV